MNDPEQPKAPARSPRLKRAAGALAVVLVLAVIAGVLLQRERTSHFVSYDSLTSQPIVLSVPVGAVFKSASQSKDCISSSIPVTSVQRAFDHTGETAAVVDFYEAAAERDGWIPQSSGPGVPPEPGKTVYSFIKGPLILSLSVSNQPNTGYLIDISHTGDVVWSC